MNNQRRSSCRLAWILLLLTLLAARKVSAADPGGVEATAKAMVGAVQGWCDPILAHPDVSDDDKAQVRALLKTVKDAADKATADLKGVPDPGEEGIGRAGWLKAYARIEEAQRGLGTLLEERPDLRWISSQGELFAKSEPIMLESKPQAYLDLLKQAGLDDAKLAQAKQAVDLLAEDLAKAQKEVSVKPPPADKVEAYKGALEYYSRKQSRLNKTRDTLRAMLTADQRARFDWLFPNASAGKVTRFSRQVGLDKAPLNGKYTLKSWAKTEAGQKMVHSSTLQQNDAVGFRKTEKGVVGVCGTAEIPLPDARELYFWAWEQEKP